MSASTRSTLNLLRRRKHRRRNQETSPTSISAAASDREFRRRARFKRLPPTLFEHPHLACMSLFVMRQYEPATVVSYNTLDDPTAKRPCIWRGHETSLPEVQAYLRCLAQGIVPRSDLQEAWNRFFERYSPAVQLAVRKFRIQHHDASDCAQEVWMKIVEQISAVKYQPARGPFLSWLARLIRNAVIDFLRRSTREGTSTLDSPANMLASRMPGPAIVFEQSEKQQLLWHLLAHLQQSTSPLNYQVLELLHLHSLSVSEVADRLHLSPEQVWYRNHRTLGKLRKLLLAHRAATD